jgi:hypothetical protein
MKKNILLFVLLSFTNSFRTQAQSTLEMDQKKSMSELDDWLNNRSNKTAKLFNPDEEYPELTSRLKKAIRFRGAIKPTVSTFSNYKNYSLKINLAPSFETTLKSRNVPLSLNAISNSFSIFALKRVTDGDFKITYNLTRFEWVNDEDYIERMYQNAPSFNIGFESNIEVRNKEGVVIYTRYTTPNVKMYVTNPEELNYNYGQLAYRIIAEDIYRLMDEFDSYYLYGPNMKIDYSEVSKKKKSKSTFNAEEFNQSSQVFEAVPDVDRENWVGLFGEAQKYWKGLVEYTDEADEDLQKSVRQGANYNLSCSYYLLGQLQEAEKYAEGVKANEKAFLGMRDKYDKLVNVKTNFEEAKKAVEEVGGVEAIQPEPILSDYKKGKNAFRFLEYDNAEAVDQDNNSYKGYIRVLSDFPEMVDWRTVQTKSALGQLTSQIGSDKGTVRIFVEGEKKPKKANLKKMVYIKDKTGKTFITGKTGGSASIITRTNMVNSKRYAIFDEIKTTKKLTLFQEIFPQDSYVLKRPTEEEFFSPPHFLGRRKALREYFADCPAMLSKIDKGEYDFDNKETYLKIYNDYEAAGCGK